MMFFWKETIRSKTSQNVDYKIVHTSGSGIFHLAMISESDMERLCFFFLFQQVNFNNNSQPHYVLITPDGRVINTPVSGYMPKEDFKKFLECGVDYYKKSK